MTPLSRRVALGGLAAGAALVVVGCAKDIQRPQSQSTDPSEQPKLDRKYHQVVPRTSVQDATIPNTAEGALAATQALIAAATAVVVVKGAAASKPSPSASATSTPGATATPSASAGPSTAASSAPPHAATALAVAKALGVPMLIDGPGLTAELDRLQTRTVITYGEGIDAGGREVIAGPASADQLPKLDGLPAKPKKADFLVLTDKEAVPAAIQATLAAAGVEPVQLKAPDPGVSSESVAAVKKATGGVVAVGSGFGSTDRFSWLLKTARNAQELPGGGTTPIPGRRMIALYGHPDGGALGLLGEQPPEQAVARLNTYVEQYQALLPDDKVIGAFEIIATVASGAAGKQGDYSYRTPIEKLLPWIETAEKHGVYVVLDLQPGRTDFLTQAKEYAELLKRPTVGLALDPEWRLTPTQKHLRQIGQVQVEEVNRVGTWLADLVRDNNLPPKVLTLHQFQTRMVVNRSRLDTSRPELDWLVHVDGQGGQMAKQSTWTVLQKNLPPRVVMGWKNFIDEDKPMLTPKQTVEQVHPTPYFISYQ